MFLISIAFAVISETPQPTYEKVMFPWILKAHFEDSLAHQSVGHWVDHSFELAKLRALRACCYRFNTRTCAGLSPLTLSLPLRSPQVEWERWVSEGGGVASKWVKHVVVEWWEIDIHLKNVSQVDWEVHPVHQKCHHYHQHISSFIIILIIPWESKDFLPLDSPSNYFQYYLLPSALSSINLTIVRMTIFLLL